MIPRWRHRLIVGVLLACLIAAVAVPALTLNRSNTSDDALPATTTTQPPIPTLVAIGDSYTAGPGVVPYEEATIANQCFRSQAAYPLRAATTLKIPGRSVACSGATAQAFTGPYKGEAAQLTRLGDADIIVLTIGGNDVRALQTLAEDPIGAASPGFLETFRTNNLAPLRGILDKAYAEIRKAAPNARVYVVNYPNPFPPNRADFQYCAGLQIPLGGAAFTLPLQNLYLLGEELNGTIKAAADAARFDYVDVNPFFRDRDICGDLRLIWGTADAPNQEGILHPTGDGHRVMGDVLAGVIRATNVPGLPAQ